MSEREWLRWWEDDGEQESKDNMDEGEKHWTGGTTTDADGNDIRWDGWQPGADPDTRERAPNFPTLFRLGTR